jgi:putative sterol carrier protein
MKTDQPIEMLIRDFADAYDPEIAAYYEGNVLLNLGGSEPCECSLIFDKSGCRVEKGRQEPIHCEIKAKSEVFRRIVNRERSPMEEFIMGNVYISNIQVIQHIGKAFEKGRPSR